MDTSVPSGRTDGRARPALVIAIVAAVVTAVVATLLPGALRGSASAQTPQNPVPGIGQAGSGTIRVELSGIAAGPPNSAEQRQGIRATFFDGELEAVRDAGSGQATGQVQFEPIVFRHAFGYASPAISRAAATGRRLQRAVFTVTEPGGRATHRITLRDVLVVRVKQYLPDASANDGLVARVPLQEEVALAFGGIEWCAVSAGGPETCTSAEPGGR